MSNPQDEDEKRRDEALKRMLNTPPRPQKVKGDSKKLSNADRKLK